MLNNSNKKLITEERVAGRDLIERLNREHTKLMYMFIFLTFVTILGWMVSHEKGQLPLKAWYPYDTTQTPAYQLTFIHQCIAAYFCGAICMSSDFIVTSLVVQCRCRLRLVILSLQALYDDLGAIKSVLTDHQEGKVLLRLHSLVAEHANILAKVELIEATFTTPILAQFCVSILILCVTAYQLAFESSDVVTTLSMSTYLLGMVFQVYVYCYQGNELVVESEEICIAAYDTPWYIMSVPLRRILIMMMMRTQHKARLTAGGFSELSLACFMSIVKVSYSFFTVLKRAGVET